MASTNNLKEKRSEAPEDIYYNITQDSQHVSYVSEVNSRVRTEVVRVLCKYTTSILYGRLWSTP